MIMMNTLMNPTTKKTLNIPTKMMMVNGMSGTKASQTNMMKIILKNRPRPTGKVVADEAHTDVPSLQDTVKANPNVLEVFPDNGNPLEKVNGDLTDLSKVVVKANLTDQDEHSMIPKKHTNPTKTNTNGLTMNGPKNLKA